MNLTVESFCATLFTAAATHCIWLALPVNALLHPKKNNHKGNLHVNLRRGFPNICYGHFFMLLPLCSDHVVLFVAFQTHMLLTRYRAPLSGQTTSTLITWLKGVSPVAYLLFKLPFITVINANTEKLSNSLLADKTGLLMNRSGSNLRFKIHRSFPEPA